MKIKRNPNKRPCVARNITIPHKRETEALLRKLKVQKRIRELMERGMFPF